MLDDMKAALDRLREAATTVPEPRLVPAMRSALDVVVEQVREQQIEAREAAREANWERLRPVFEASMERVAEEDALAQDREEREREEKLAADPNSFEALLRRPGSGKRW